MVGGDGALTALDLMINSAHAGVASAGSDRGSQAPLQRPPQEWRLTIERAVDHTTSRMISPKTIAARKKKANVTSADRSAILDALPRNDQFRLYSP
jgi:hypothetical protein